MPGVQYKDRVIEAQSYKSPRGSAGYVTRPRPDPTREEFLARMDTARGARGEMLTWPPRGRPIRAGLYAVPQNAPKPLEGSSTW